jgi:predicted secreted Zn-dependent protease
MTKWLVNVRTLLRNDVMLTQTQLTRINEDKDLCAAVEKVIADYKKKNPMVLIPEDLSGNWDVYLEGVKMTDVFYIDLEKQMVRKYIKPLVIENGHVKYVELYGKVRLQKMLF